MFRHIFHYVVDLLLRKAGLRNVVRTHQLLLVYQTIVRLVEDLESLQLDPFTTITNDLWGDQFKKLLEFYEAVAICVDFVNNGLYFLLVEILSQSFHNLVEFLTSIEVTLIEMEPDPS